MNALGAIEGGDIEGGDIEGGDIEGGKGAYDSYFFSLFILL